eukprot:gene4263-biopygen3911
MLAVGDPFMVTWFRGSSSCDPKCTFLFPMLHRIQISGAPMSSHHSVAAVCDSPLTSCQKTAPCFPGSQLGQLFFPRGSGCSPREAAMSFMASPLERAARNSLHSGDCNSMSTCSGGYATHSIFTTVAVMKGRPHNRRHMLNFGLGRWRRRRGRGRWLGRGLGRCRGRVRGRGLGLGCGLRLGLARGRGRGIGRRCGLRGRGLARGLGRGLGCGRGLGRGRGRGLGGFHGDGHFGADP